MAPAAPLGKVRPSPTAKQNIGTITEGSVRTPLHAMPAIVRPATAPSEVPHRMVRSSPRRGPKRPERKLPAMSPTATAPKERPNTLGERPSRVMSTKAEPEMKANWPPNMRALASA